MQEALGLVLLTCHQEASGPLAQALGSADPLKTENASWHTSSRASGYLSTLLVMRPSSRHRIVVTPRDRVDGRCHAYKWQRASTGVCLIVERTYRSEQRPEHMIHVLRTLSDRYRIPDGVLCPVSKLRQGRRYR